MRSQSKPSLFKDKRFFFGFIFVCGMLFVAISADWLAPFSPDAMNLRNRLASPSLEHIMGVDSFGADIFSAMLRGTRNTLAIGFSVVLLTSIVGTFFGLLAGYNGGWIDHVIMRICDVLMAFPGILAALAASALLGSGLWNVIVAISITGWTSSARLVRAQTLSVRSRDFVQAAVVLGAPSARIILLHVLPQIWSPLLILATFSLSGVILVEASLSFLGFGTEANHASWGYILNQGRDLIFEAMHISLFPGLAILCTVLAINFLGDSLRDHFDPKNTES